MWRKCSPGKLLHFSCKYLQLRLIYFSFSLPEFKRKSSIEKITPTWFTTEEVSKKRRSIAETIAELSRENLKTNSPTLQLPQLQFEPATHQKRRKSRKSSRKQDAVVDAEKKVEAGSLTFSATGTGFYEEESVGNQEKVSECGGKISRRRTDVKVGPFVQNLLVGIKDIEC